MSGLEDATRAVEKLVDPHLTHLPGHAQAQLYVMCAVSKLFAMEDPIEADRLRQTFVRMFERLSFESKKN